MPQTSQHEQETTRFLREAERTHPWQDRITSEMARAQKTPPHVVIAPMQILDKPEPIRRKQGE